MMRFALRYLGHRPGASLSNFTGAGVNLVPGQEFTVLAEGLVLGRSASAGLRVASSQVARAHARIEPVPNGLAIDDLGSSNGTSVNGDQVLSAIAHAGDRLTLAAAFDFEIVAQEG